MCAMQESISIKADSLRRQVSRSPRPMDIYLIRHARSTWNRDGRVQGHRNPPLSDEGKTSARHLAEYLRSRFGPFSQKKSILVASPLRRAHETARILSGRLNLPVARRADLREASLGEWEGKTVSEIRQTDFRRLARWYRDPTRVRLKGGEPIPVFQKRVRREVQRLLYIYGEAESLLLVTHGGWISALLTDVVGIPLGRMWTFVLDNCSLTRLHWDGKKFYLRSFNETASSTGRTVLLA